MRPPATAECTDDTARCRIQANLRVSFSTGIRWNIITTWQQATRGAMMSIGSSEGRLREAMGDGVEFKGGSFWREIEGMAHHMAIARVVHEIIG